MERLRFLKQAYADDLITASEYEEHKRVVLRAISGDPIPKADAAAAEGCGRPVHLDEFEKGEHRLERS